MDFLPPILLPIGLVALIGRAELLVRGATRIAFFAGISPLVVGLTIVAFGTSAPELGVSVFASLAGQADVALGNVVGSNIANVLLILGLSALAAPLAIDRQLLRVDVPLMIGSSLMAFVMSLNGAIGRLEGGLLFSGLIGYTVWTIYRTRCGTPPGTKAATPFLEDQGSSRKRSLFIHLLLVLAGLLLLALGSTWLVSGAVSLARLFNISEMVIGLTIVAMGTSLPELATSVLASLRGQRDIAVGNIIGSNIFNILFVLGISAAITPGGVPVAEQALRFDLPVMVVVAAACLPIFLTDYRISQWEGSFLTAYYLMYVFYLVLNAIGYDGLWLLNRWVIRIGLPITLLLLGFSVVRTVQGRRGRRRLAS